MDIRQLKALAQQRLTESRYSAKKLALLFTGAAVALSLIMTLVSFLLNQQIDNTGGLSKIGVRTMLSSIQLFMLIGGTLAIPFWNLGYTRAALDTVRQGNAEPRTLLAGFRLFFPAVRLFFLQAALITVLVIASMHAGAILYMLTPVSMLAMEALEPLLAGGEAAFADPAVAQKLLSLFWPMYLLIGIVLLVVLIPVMYRLRLVEFSLVDGMERALQNMARSNYLMRGKCFWMFRLDLSFWWYFLLQGVAAVLAYGDLLVGGGDLAYWIFYLLSSGVQLVLGWLFLPRVQASYALAYDEILKEKDGQIQ